MPFSTFSRRSALLGAAAATSALVAACSKAKPQAAPHASSPTTPAPAGPRVTGAGLPADLLKVLTALYLGGNVPSSGAVAAALGKRRPLAHAVKVTGTTGTWKGDAIASVVAGPDLTLLVRSGRTWTVVGGWWPSLKVARPPMRTMRILAVGSDARTGQPVRKCRGDAIHLIGVDPRHGIGGIVGIPRDSWVRLSSGGSGKINSSLVYSDITGMVHTVSSATGVPIDGHVLTGFAGFRAMISALGGIVVVSRSSLKSVDGFRIVKPGTNRLDAKHALAFARERHHLSNGDFGRSLNQGVLIKSGVVMAQKAGPANLARLLSRMGSHLLTDLSVGDVLNLSASLYLSSAGAIPNTVVPGSVGTRDGQSVVLLGGAARRVFADLRNGRLGA